MPDCIVYWLEVLSSGQSMQLAIVFDEKLSSTERAVKHPVDNNIDHQLLVKRRYFSTAS